MVHQPDDVQNWVITLAKKPPMATLVTFLMKVPQHIARGLSIQQPEAPPTINPFEMGMCMHFPPHVMEFFCSGPQNKESPKRKKVRRVGVSERQRFMHPYRDFTPGELSTLNSLGITLDGTFKLWDADGEGQWFQDMRSPPCSLTQAMYSKVLHTLVRSMKGNTPFYALWGHPPSDPDGGREKQGR